MRFILCFILMSLIGCMKESIATTAVIKSESGESFPIERIFTLDGCGIYRLRDGATVGYFSACPQVVCSAPKSCPTPTPTPKKHRLEEESSD